MTLAYQMIQLSSLCMCNDNFLEVEEHLPVITNIARNICFAMNNRCRAFIVNVE